jgi:DNA mismatch endonuclease (patch repair protein)
VSTILQLVTAPAAMQESTLVDDMSTSPARNVCVVAARTRSAEKSSTGTAHAMMAVPSSPAVSARMSRARSEDTTPELELRSELHRRGLRFRVHRPLAFNRRRRADIVFPREQIAVFVDGCFWHSCPEHATRPKANAEFWRDKLERNRQRDTDTDRMLEQSGWCSLRIWEHERPSLAADRIETLIRVRRAAEMRADPSGES